MFLGDDLMNYYKHKDKVLITNENLQFEKLCEDDLKKFNGHVFYGDKKPLDSFRSFFKINSTKDLKEETLEVLKNHENSKDYPSILLNAINENRASFINLNNDSFMDIINSCTPKKWRVNVVGLGDVGGTLITGLRLLGGDIVESIGIFDLDKNKINRWIFECNQILDINNPTAPYIEEVKEDELFNCDMFVFCVSVGVPEVGREKEDVRLVQFEGNKKVLSLYAKKARENNFNGIFSVVSDPVDLLCKVAFNESNKNSNGEFDFKGLKSHQVKGFGLGVMNARANHFAMENPETRNYLKEGRAFGPHGEGLIIINSMTIYNEDLSNMLTLKTKTANLKIRSAGFKPYIAPALSSGTISLLATMRGQWHYSANFIGGTFMGCKNIITPYGTKLETYDFPSNVFEKLQSTYDYLNSIYN